MYEIFVDLLQKKGVTPYKVAKATGIGNSTFTDWKNGRSTPKLDKLAKIADYLDCSVDYLLGKTDDPRTTAQILEDSVNNAKGKIVAHDGDGTTYVDKGFAADYYKFFPKDAPKSKYGLCGGDEIIDITKEEFEKLKTILFTIRN